MNIYLCDVSILGISTTSDLIKMRFKMFNEGYYIIATLAVIFAILASMVLNIS